MHRNLTSIVSRSLPFWHNFTQTVYSLVISAVFEHVECRWRNRFDKGACLLQGCIPRSSYFCIRLYLSLVWKPYSLACMPCTYCSASVGPTGWMSGKIVPLLFSRFLFFFFCFISVYDMALEAICGVKWTRFIAAAVAMRRSCVTRDIGSSDVWPSLTFHTSLT